MGRFLHHLRGIGRREDVYLVDVTEHWNDGIHAYWAFTEASWYEWAAGGAGSPPASLRRASPDDAVGADPTADERVQYLIGGALADGEFVGRGQADLEQWLAGRVPLGVLTTVENTSPFRPD